MNYTIRLTPAELKLRATEIVQNSENVKKEMSELIKLAGALRTTFLGETAQSFFKEFDTKCSDIDRWADVVNSFANEIQEAANKLEAADRSVRS